MGVVTTVLAFLLAVGILIVVHELGHFTVARLCGVKVLRFSVGFGRPLLRWVRGPDRTEWVVCAVPYGGYVKMLDERDTDSGPVAPAEVARAFNRQSVARRSAIVAAGPLANLLLAVLFYWLINVTGTLEPAPVIAAPPAGTLAAQAGLGEGDLVVTLDGRSVRSWNELRWALMQDGLAGAIAPLTVRAPDGALRSVQLDLSSARSTEVDEAWFVDKLGLDRGPGPPIIRGLVAAEVAERSGLEVGDRVVAIDGAPMRTAADVTHSVQASAGRTQQWEIERAGGRVQRALTPVALALPDGRTIGRVGIDFNDVRLVRYGPVEALQRAGARTWDTTVFTVRMVVRMIDGRASLRNLSGPVTTAEVAGKTWRIGFFAYLSFLALVSISIGVFNLLPIPVLDGGHLLYYAVEVVKGSPPSVRTVELAQRVGVGMLMLLTALALYNDLTRLLS
jgi:regulator of sigma E protease